MNNISTNEEVDPRETEADISPLNRVENENATSRQSYHQPSTLNGERTTASFASRLKSMMREEGRFKQKRTGDYLVHPREVSGVSHSDRRSNNLHESYKRHKPVFPTENKMQKSLVDSVNSSSLPRIRSKPVFETKKHLFPVDPKSSYFGDDVSLPLLKSSDKFIKQKSELQKGLDQYLIDPNPKISFNKAVFQSSENFLFKPSFPSKKSYGNNSRQNRRPALAKPKPTKLDSTKYLVNHIKSSPYVSISVLGTENNPFLEKYPLLRGALHKKNIRRAEILGDSSLKSGTNNEALVSVPNDKYGHSRNK